MAVCAGPGKHSHLNTVKCPFVGQTFHVSSFAFHISRTIQNGRPVLSYSMQDGTRRWYTSSHANQVSKQVKIECPISLSKQVVNIKMTTCFEWELFALTLLVLQDQGYLISLC